MKPADHLRIRVAAQQNALAAQAAAIVESAARIRRVNTALETGRTSIVSAGPKRIAPHRTEPPAAQPASPEKPDQFIAGILRRLS